MRFNQERGGYGLSGIRPTNREVDDKQVNDSFNSAAEFNDQYPDGDSEPVRIFSSGFMLLCAQWGIVIGVVGYGLYKLFQHM